MTKEQFERYFRFEKNFYSEEDAEALFCCLREIAVRAPAYHLEKTEKASGDFVHRKDVGSCGLRRAKL